MKHEIIITFEGRFVQVISRGEKSFEFSLKIWPETIKLCRENECYKVLGIATSSKPPSTIDSYKHGDLFHKFKIDGKYKIAWVELNPKSYEGIKFIETVLFNRGVDVKLFADVDKAKTWLLSED
jgi:hypothetical protein